MTMRIQAHTSIDTRCSAFSVHFNSYAIMDFYRAPCLYRNSTTMFVQKRGIKQKCRHFPSLIGKSSRSKKTMMNSSQKVPPSTADEFGNGEEGLWSVIIPTYNRLPILTKCLTALEEQKGYSDVGIRDYEVIVVDDGSTDGTLQFLLNENGGAPADGNGISVPNSQGYSLSNGSPILSKRFPHVKVLQQQHGGPTRARNLGFLNSRGSIIVFIDSDVVVTSDFLRDHSRALDDCFMRYGDDRTFTYGRVINTTNFENPDSEPFKITDNTFAFFDTCNVAISRKHLASAENVFGELSEEPFDSTFSEYGWEDLELGLRLRKDGVRIKRFSSAVGFHWHPSFSYDRLPLLIEKEKQRGRSAAHFYSKHPVHNVRRKIQMTPMHQTLWFLLTLGGLLNEKTLAPLLRTLVAWGKPQLAEGLISPLLNWYAVQETKEAIRKSR